MDADKLKGMAIISVAEGARLGRVDEVLFDTAGLRAGGLHASGEGQNFVVPFEQVKNIGADAVTVESSQVTQAASKGATFDALTSLSALKKRKVVDETGALIGTVASLDIDPASGKITSITAHKGGVLGLGGASTVIDASSVHGVGPELLTIAALPEPPAEQH